MHSIYKRGTSMSSNNSNNYSRYEDIYNNEIFDVVENILMFCMDHSNFEDFFNKGNITYEFSPEIKINKYGVFSDKEVIETIKEANIKDKNIKTYVDDLYERFICENKNENRIGEILEQLRKYVYEDEIYSDIYDLKCIIKKAEGRIKESFILGEYKDRKITFYIETIKNTAEVDDKFAEDNFRRVMAHEMFNAYHHFIFDGAKTHLSRFNNCEKQAQIVKESLASYFEYEACRCFKLSYEKQIESMWNNYSFEYCPCVGAKYINDYTKKELGYKGTIVNKIIEDSKIDFIDAYYDIVHMYMQSTNYKIDPFTHKKMMLYINNNH